MNIVRIHGGLGNQLFCYAFAKYLDYIGVPDISLDITSGFESDFYKRSYKLQEFNISLKTINREELKPITIYLESKTLRRIDRFRKLINKNLIYYEKSHLHAEELHIVNDTNYFIGYWQSYIYSDTIFEKLKADLKLQFSNNEDSLNKYVEEFRKFNSVSIHVRYPHAYSGKEVSQKALNLFKTLDFQYYDKAISLIKSKYKSIKFYVFSDNIEYAKSLLKTIKGLIYIEGFNELQDFYLLQNSKHFIIANSTFSWWGARLGESNDSIVICPKNWYLKKYNDLSQLLPQRWVKIQN